MSRERFWDGDAWSAQVRDSGTQVRPAMPGLGEDAPTVIGSPPPSGGAPEPFEPFRPSIPLRDLDDLDRQEADERTRRPDAPPPGGPGPRGPVARATYVAPGTPAPTRGRRTGLVAGLVVLALVVVGGGLTALLLLGGGDEVAVDPGGGTTAPSTPSASPQLAGLCSSGDSLEDVKSPDDGRVHGGGLSFDVPRGYRVDDDAAFPYGFTTDPAAASTRVGGGYTATYAVAALDRSDFGTLREAADSVSECYATGNFYLDPIPTYLPGEMSDLTVDGRPAVSMQSELPLVEAPTPGADVLVIVVDTDDPDTYGLFVADQVLGDAAMQRQREQVVEDLRVD